MSDETSAAIAGEAGLLRELAAALNRHCVENESDTPDFVLAEYARASLDALASAIRARDKWAGRAAASSEPRTIPPLTDDDEAEMFRRFQSFGYKDNYRHYYALAASRLGATVAASGTMSEKQAEFLTSPDLDAIKREAAREALTKLANRAAAGGDEAVMLIIEAFRDREYPAPVPEPPHVMVNGWRVTWDGKDYKAVNDISGVRTSYRSAGRLCVTLAADGCIDTDVVRVLALREGRGDQ